MKKIWSAVLGLALALGVAPAAHAQVFSPTFQAPFNSSDVGVYLVDFESELGVEGILRRNQLGLRLGVVDGTLLAGIDYRSPLAVSAAPLSLALTLGGQGAFGDGAEVFGGQVGLSVGGRIVSPGIAVVPYIHPRLAVIAGEGDSEFKVLADLGVDLDFNRNLSLRFGANLGDGADFGIGLAFKR